MSSIWKNNISLSIFGQSHGAAIGMTLDGIPAGESIDMEVLQQFLSRRAPGGDENSPWATPRKESDIPEFLSGIVDGKTCGAPITAIIRNENTRAVDYAELRDVPRPGHADFTAHIKYNGFQDSAGGGHFSGRLTAALCIAGGICLQILARHGVHIGAHILSIGDIEGRGFDPVAIDVATLTKLDGMKFSVSDPPIAAKMIDRIAEVKSNNDSIGGVIECAIIGLPPGLGNPMFNGMENRLSQLVFAIPAVKGMAFGAGFEATKMLGSVHNDPFCFGESGGIKTKTNNHGGILGGITTGMPLIFRTAIKPTPSIGIEQDSISLGKKEPTKLKIKGRHDPCIVPRAVPCVIAAAAIGVLDAMEGR